MTIIMIITEKTNYIYYKQTKRNEKKTNQKKNNE